MLPTMRAALRLVSPVRSRRPRCTTGTTSAREGASMVLMKVVASSVSRHACGATAGGGRRAAGGGRRAGVWFVGVWGFGARFDHRPNSGAPPPLANESPLPLPRARRAAPPTLVASLGSAMAASRLGTSAAISGDPMTRPTSPSASRAAAWTCPGWEGGCKGGGARAQRRPGPRAPAGPRRRAGRPCPPLPRGDDSTTSGGGAPHLGVGVRQHAAEARHDGGQAAAELLGRAVRHRAQQLRRPLLRAPRRVLQALEQRRQHELHARRRELAHDRARRVGGGLAHRR
jgi:hypothetical protein